MKLNLALHIPMTTEFFNVYISNINGHDHYPIEISFNDTTTSNDSKKSEIFNEHFYSVNLHVATQKLLRMTWMQHLPQVL